MPEAIAARSRRPVRRRSRGSVHHSIISAVSWSFALGIGLLSVSRMTLGRLPE